MTLTYKPIDSGHVPAHVRNAFAERCPSNPPSDEPHPAPGWHGQSKDKYLRYYWLRKVDEHWHVATKSLSFLNRDEWLALLERYHTMPHRKTWAEARVRGVLFGPSVSDFDDNIPEEWARELFERWGMPL